MYIIFYYIIIYYIIIYYILIISFLVIFTLKYCNTKKNNPLYLFFVAILITVDIDLSAA